MIINRAFGKCLYHGPRPECAAGRCDLVESGRLLWKDLEEPVSFFWGPLLSPAKTEHYYKMKDTAHKLKGLAFVLILVDSQGSMKHILKINV